MSKTLKERYITAYEEGENTLFQVYVNKRSDIVPTIRVQKRIRGIETLQEAINLRNKWNDLLIKQIKEKESKGYTWGEIVNAFETYWKTHPGRTFNQDTLHDHIARAHNWTSVWWNKFALDITTGDARDLMKDAFDDGASQNVRTMVKRTVNQIWKWAVEEKMIIGKDLCPAKNVETLCQNETATPSTSKEILNYFEIVRFLTTAKEKDHPWYPVWFVALHTGMRSGELEALRKEQIELVPIKVAKKLDGLKDGDQRKNYGFIHVKFAFKQKQKKYGGPKGGYERKVPVNSELYWFLREYLPTANFKKDEIGERIFENHKGWRGNRQASYIRAFCESSKLPSIKFHTLRACWATQLLGLGIPTEQVMLSGGWRDVETMRIYIRNAGILVQGSTEGLKFMSDNALDLESNIINRDYRLSTELDDPDDGLEEKLEAAGAEKSLPKPTPALNTNASSNVISFHAFRRNKSC